jgi:hypothetical protein
VRSDSIRAHQKQKKLEDCGQNLRKWLRSERKIGNVGVFQTLLSLNSCRSGLLENGISDSENSILTADSFLLILREGLIQFYK